MALSETIDEFKLAKFKFRMLCCNNFNLPQYKGATFRGGFGSTFKRVICDVKHGDCTVCLKRDNCTYTYVFETKRPNGAGLMRKAVDIPRPFIIETIESKKRNYKYGDELIINLILIGRAIKYLPLFILTFEALGKHGIGRNNEGRYYLDEVRSLAIEDEDNALIYDGNIKKIISGVQTISFNDMVIVSQDLVKAKELKLIFLTLTKIKDKYISDEKLFLTTFMKNLFRRISLLANFHCDCDINFNLDVLRNETADIIIKTNLNWNSWSRFSTRQKCKITFNGFTGDIIFPGNLDKYLPFLYLGQYIHVGSGTVFGLGQYKLAKTNYF